MLLTIESKEEIKLQPQQNTCKGLLTVQRLIGTLLTIVSFDVFLLFFRESNYFIMLMFKFPVFILFVEPHAVPKYIGLINLLSKLRFYYI